jgi:uncharacterized protein YkwD
MMYLDLSQITMDSQNDDTNGIYLGVKGTDGTTGGSLLAKFDDERFDVEDAAWETTGIKVDSHSEAEIRQYIQSQNITLESLERDGSDTTKYEETPSVVAPYSAGKMSSDSQEYALKVLNSVRYIAGLSEVELNEKYGEMAQAASLVNAANDEMVHYPSQPEGMADDLYDLGYGGAARSNLSCSSWNATYAYHIVHSWMADSDNSNIAVVGHRRWILNPYMGYTGFGQAESTSGRSHCSLYAFDESQNNNQYGVVWPAQNMPVEYFDSDSAWSISLGTEVDYDSVKVKLTSLTTGQSWVFCKGSPYGAFYVGNSCYGQSGCIIFRPSLRPSYSDGDSFKVEVVGTDSPIKYQVNFFSLANTSTSATTSFKKGDIDGDGAINGKDVNILAQFCVGKTTLSDEQKKAADVDGDGSVTGKDVNILAQVCVGKATLE